MRITCCLDDPSEKKEIRALTMPPRVLNNWMAASIESLNRDSSDWSLTCSRADCGFQSALWWSSAGISNFLGQYIQPYWHIDDNIHLGHKSVSGAFLQLDANERALKVRSWHAFAHLDLLSLAGSVGCSRGLFVGIRRRAYIHSWETESAHVVATVRILPLRKSNIPKLLFLVLGLTWGDSQTDQAGQSW